MRRRIALSVTCVCLILCVAFALIFTQAAVGRMVRSSADDLMRICRMSAVYLDNAAFSSPEERKDAVKRLAEEVGVGVALLDGEGVLVAESQISASANALSDEDVKQALTSESGQGLSERTFRGVNTQYAACRMANGEIVRVWSPAPSVRDFSDVRLRIILIVLLVGALCVLLVQSIVTPAQLLVTGTKSLLEGFAEGRFEERIVYKGKGRAAEWAAEINEAAARIEERLMRQNRRTQAMTAVMNQSQNGMLAVDDGMRIILVTESAKQLLGIKGNCDGVPLQEASKDVNLEEVFREGMQHDGIYTNEVAVRMGTTGRGRQPLRLYVSPLKQDGHPIGAVALVEDITELRRLEEVRTDFAANVSHELKTPLTSIKGFVETLMEGAIDNPEMARKFLRIIMLEADRLTRLINDILSITKMESGQAEGSFERIQMDKMVADTVEVLSIHAADKGVTITTNQPKEPMYVWGNSDRVEQMLMNLVENAIKYNKQDGQVMVSVYGTGENVQLLVSDTGIGIPEEHLPRLFERFYRVDKGRSRSMGGTGLGLAIVKHIVVSMGGMIEVHSKFGEGTEFLVTLPRYFGETEEKESQEEDAYEV